MLCNTGMSYDSTVLTADDVYFSRTTLISTKNLTYFNDLIFVLQSLLPRLSRWVLAHYAAVAQAMSCPLYITGFIVTTWHSKCPCSITSDIRYAPFKLCIKCLFKELELLDKYNTAVWPISQWTNRNSVIPRHTVFTNDNRCDELFCVFLTYSTVNTQTNTVIHQPTHTANELYN